MMQKAGNVVQAAVSTYVKALINLAKKRRREADKKQSLSNHTLPLKSTQY